MHARQDAALKEHLAGRFNEASALYTMILKETPDKPDVWYLWGVTAFQKGDYSNAAERMHKAIELDPEEACYHNQLGVVYAGMGRCEEAIQSFRRAVRLKPDFAEAYRSLLQLEPDNISASLALGSVFEKRNQFRDALVCYREALQRNPRAVDLFVAIGCLLEKMDRHGDAETVFREALQTHPDNAELHLYLGQVLYRQERTAEAATCFEQAVALKSDFLTAWRELASVYRVLDRPEAMIKAYESIVALSPDDTTARFKLGCAYQGMGRLDAAVRCYTELLPLVPDSPHCLNNLACARMGRGDVEAAMRCFEECVSRFPDFAEGRFNFGRALKEMGEIDGVIREMQAAIRLCPDMHAAYNELGIALSAKRHYQKAIDHYQQVLRIKPGHGPAYYNIACALQEMGAYESAIDYYQQAIDANPDFAEAHFNKALLLLLLGHYREAWPEYEWRFKRSDMKDKYWSRFDVPAWDGGDIKGKWLYVQNEQGLGDTLQFVRFMPLLKALGANVVFEAKEQLMPLLKSAAGIDILVSRETGEIPPCVDCYTYLFSLPLLLDITLDKLPAECPYLCAENSKIDFWRRRLDGDDLKIGLAWAGNPDNPDDKYRSVPLEHFAPLAQLGGVRILGLQKGPRADEAKTVSWKNHIENLGDALQDFSDTAAVMANLDLVISVDTAIVHLAGALGRPVWNLRHARPYWVWMRDRTDSPWYPSMKLYRQRTPGNWAPVIRQVAIDLAWIVENADSGTPCFSG